MTASDERRRILDLLDNGIITAEQAIQLMAAVEDGDEPEEETPSLASGVSEDLESRTMPNLDDLPAEGDAAADSKMAPAQADTAADSDPAPAADAEADAKAYAYAPGPLPEPEAIGSEPEDAPETGPDKPEVPFDAGQGWRKWWQWPLWIGVSITVIAAGFMYLAYKGSGFGFWFACTWFPFLFGVALMALAWASRTAHWVHVRVQQKPGEKPERIAISLPIPLRLTAWALRTFKDRIPGMNKYNAAEMVMALRNITPDAPLYVKVDEGEDGEKVEVYIG